MKDRRSDTWWRPIRTIFHYDFYLFVKISWIRHIPEPDVPRTWRKVGDTDRVADFIPDKLDEIPRIVTDKTVPRVNSSQTILDAAKDEQSHLISTKMTS